MTHVYPNLSPQAVDGAQRTWMYTFIAGNGSLNKGEHGECAAQFSFHSQSPCLYTKVFTCYYLANLHILVEWNAQKQTLREGYTSIKDQPTFGYLPMMEKVWQFDLGSIPSTTMSGLAAI